MSRAPRSPRSLALALATAGVLLGLTACGGADPKPGPEVAGGNPGVDERASATIKVLAVTLAYPADGVYRTGEDADLSLAISNTGHAPDTLVDVTGPDFSDVHLNGGAQVSLVVPESQTVFVGAENEPSLTLVDLQRSLRSSQSVQVTFVFKESGPVTVDAVVAAEGQDPRSDRLAGATGSDPDPKG